MYHQLGLTQRSNTQIMTKGQEKSVYISAKGQYIYLFTGHTPYPFTTGSACNNVKKRDKKERTKKKWIRKEDKIIHSNLDN